MRDFLKKQKQAFQKRVMNLQEEIALRAAEAENERIWTMITSVDLTTSNQGEEFLHYVPRMHKYKRIRRYLNGYGNICTAYCKEIIRLGVSEEVELAFIRDNAPGEQWNTNTLWYLYHNGHKFSPRACEEMQKCCPDAYRLMYPNK